MGIREIPESYEKFQQFACDYERDNFCFAETNQRVGTATRDLFASWMPRIFTLLVRWGIYALLDDAMQASLGPPNSEKAALIDDSLSQGRNGGIPIGRLRQLMKIYASWFYAPKVLVTARLPGENDRLTVRCKNGVNHLTRIVAGELP